MSAETNISPVKPLSESDALYAGFTALCEKERELKGFWKLGGRATERGFRERRRDYAKLYWETRRARQAVYLHFKDALRRETKAAQ